MGFFTAKSLLVIGARLFYFPPMTSALNRYEPAAEVSAAPKPSLAGMTKAELSSALAEAGVPANQVRMRVAQLWNWIYTRGAQHLLSLTNVAKTRRADLDVRFTLARPQIAASRSPRTARANGCCGLQPQRFGRARAGN